MDALFHHRILSAAAAYGNDSALTDSESGITISFTALRKLSYRLARLLKGEYNVQKGDIVICSMGNSIYHPVVFLALALLGCATSAIGTEMSLKEVDGHVRRTNAKLIIHCGNAPIRDGIALLPIDAILARLRPLSSSDDDGEGEGIDASLSIDSSDINEDDTLLAALSSGTTGEPKCVLLTHRNFNAATNALKGALFDELSARGGGRRSTIALLPFHHASGFWALCYCLLEGHHSLVMDSFQPDTLLRLVEHHKVDTLNVVPSIVRFFVQQQELLHTFDLSSLTTVLCGSAAMDVGVMEQFLRLLPSVTSFIQGYGMTEVVVLSHATPLNMIQEERGRHAGSCGKLLPSFEARIVPVGESSGGDNTEGELWLRSPCVMKGYLPAGGDTPMEEGGWMRTGDLVRCDPDGFYYVVDRLRHLIKVNGLQVSPLELEQLILACPAAIGVEEAAVIGVPDAARGEVPRAFVVLKGDDGDQSVEDRLAVLSDYVNGQLPPFKQLRGGIRIVSDLPKTASGKVAKGALKSMNE